VEQNRLFTGIYYKISMHQQGKMYTIISLPMNCLKQKKMSLKLNIDDELS